MVFKPSFFLDRQRLVGEAAATGHTELGDLLGQYLLVMDHLAPSGIIRPRPYIKLPSMCRFEPTEAGVRWLVEKARYDLILVKPGAQASVLAMALEAPAPVRFLEDRKRPGYMWTLRLTKHGFPGEALRPLSYRLRRCYRDHGIVVTMDVHQFPHTVFCSALARQASTPERTLRLAHRALGLLHIHGFETRITVVGDT